MTSSEPETPWHAIYMIHKRLVRRDFALPVAVSRHPQGGAGSKLAHPALMRRMAHPAGPCLSEANDTADREETRPAQPRQMPARREQSRRTATRPEQLERMRRTRQERRQQ